MGEGMTVLPGHFPKKKKSINFFLGKSAWLNTMK